MSSQLASQQQPGSQAESGESLLTPDFSNLDAEALLKDVKDTELPPRVTEIAAEYEHTIGTRSPFVWQWIYSLFPEFTLSCVDPEYAEDAREAKTLLTIYITTLDDIAEQERDEATFEAGQRLPLAGKTEIPGADDEALEFLERVWDAFEAKIAGSPRYAEFAELFRYDLRQTFNAMRYSLLLCENPEIANLEGSYRYGQHNMVMFAYADVDLFHSSGFDTDDYGTLRQTIWNLQPMARIGNWVSTWEREIQEGDYSSGVVISALDQGIISPQELNSSTTDASTLVDRIREAGVEKQFLAEWKQLFADVKASDLAADTVDLDAFVTGMRTVMQYHLASRGYK